MNLTTLDCPHCGKSISLSEALEHELKEQINVELAQRLQLEKNRLSASMKKEAQEKLQELQNELLEKNKKLDEQRNIEMELRKKARLLEDKEKNLELEFMRRFDQEKRAVEQQLGQKLNEENRLKMAEKEKQLSDMRRQIEELKQKAEQGPVELQGEVLERELEAELRSTFFQDTVEPVAKGMRGGDIVHSINSTSGQRVGSILWETKRTKHWAESWVQKLKDDQRQINADVAILVTQVMPKGISIMGFYEGVWLCDYTSAITLGRVLRGQLVQVYQARMQAQGKNEKMDFLYEYLTGTPFRQRVEAILEAFKTMSEELDKEKRFLQKSWALRETQIAKVLTSTAGMYGDIQGIVGQGLPVINELEWEERRQ